MILVTIGTQFFDTLVEEVDRARRVEQATLLPRRAPVPSFEAKYDISDPR